MISQHIKDFENESTLQKLKQITPFIERSIEE